MLQDEVLHDLAQWRYCDHCVCRLIFRLERQHVSYARGHLEERVLAMRDGIERGESISRTATNAGIFDPLVLQMIAVGEESGTLDNLLQELAAYYDREVEYSIEKLSASIGPILTIVIGIIMLFFALAIFLPMWGLADVAMNRPQIPTM